ncbi:MAG: substrate-binding domain-containing protein [Polaromonas sp.]|nr:substrate-binding domain-containing protein [Polaromonas sp.]
MSDELHLISGGAAQGLVGQVAPDFSARTGLPVTGTFGAVGLMKTRLLEGAPCDVIILTAALIDELMAAGQLAPHSAVALGEVSTGIAVKSGDALPPVATPDELRDALRAATGIYVPDLVKSTAGIHVMKVLHTLGLADELADRLRAFPNGATAMAEMARCDEPGLIGCTQVTEILFTPGVDLVAPLPAPLGLSTVYTAAVTVHSALATDAHTLVRLLAAPEAAATRRACGFD